MKAKKIISVLSAAAVAASALCTAAFAEIITMTDAGYGVNGGKSFFPDDITAYTSTLGDLADKYDSIDFTISVADLGGREDLSYQVYVSADNWAVWANGLTGDTPPISEAGKEYSFSLNVDEIAETYGKDLVICDMGFQVLSSVPGDIDVTYSVNYSENGSSADKTEETTAAEETEAAADSAEASGETTVSTSDSTNTVPANEDKGSPDTGVMGISVCFAAAAASAGAVMVLGKRK